MRAALLIVCVVAIALVARDLVVSQLFDARMLCRRQDGSAWRAASGCSRAEDPQCRSGECVGSEFASERARQSDTWVLFHRSLPPSGAPPYFDGRHPGSGRYVER